MNMKYQFLDGRAGLVGDGVPIVDFEIFRIIIEIIIYYDNNMSNYKIIGVY